MILKFNANCDGNCWKYSFGPMSFPWDSCVFSRVFDKYYISSSITWSKQIDFSECESWGS